MHCHMVSTTTFPPPCLALPPQQPSYQPCYTQLRDVFIVMCSSSSMNCPCMPACMQADTSSLTTRLWPEQWRPWPHWLSCTMASLLHRESFTRSWVSADSKQQLHQHIHHSRRDMCSCHMSRDRVSHLHSTVLRNVLYCQHYTATRAVHAASTTCLMHCSTRIPSTQGLHPLPDQQVTAFWS